MIKLTATDFLDYLNRSGESKVRKVESIYNRKLYFFPSDFYLLIKRLIIRVLTKKVSKSCFKEFLLNLEDKRKYAHYASILKGFKKFIGKNNFEYFTPPNGIWNHVELNVGIKPEFGIILNGEKYIIKVYFKEDKLDQEKANCITTMMEDALVQGIFTSYKCGVLDIRRGKLYLKLHGALTKVLLEAEADTFLKIWNSIERKNAA